jgi:hypothetical protein
MCSAKYQFETYLSRIRLICMYFFPFQSKAIRVETSNAVLGHDVWSPLMAAMPAASVRINAPAMEITPPLVQYVEATGSTIETNANSKEPLALPTQTSPSSFRGSAVSVNNVAETFLFHF